jgi:xanthine dehydrogenase molybdopterin-binding subunit B
MGRKIHTFFCNYRGVMSSMVCTFSVTATGEPPLCMSCSVLFALRYALDSARKEAGKPDEWYQIGM